MTEQTEHKETYIQRIRKNIKERYLEGKISKRYSFNSFCNRFIPDLYCLDEQEEERCICGHPITRNFKYTHVKCDDYFILGRCCIEKFSKYHENQRKCKGCDTKIRKNKSNYCKKCIDDEKKKIKEEKEKIRYYKKCQCKDCGYQKKDDKYRYCYKCFQRRKEYL